MTNYDLQPKAVALRRAFAMAFLGILASPGSLEAG